MKKILLLIIAICLALPCMAQEIYNDGLYTYQTDNVLFKKYENKMFYTLYVTPLLNAAPNDRYYKLSVSQNTINGFLNVSQVSTLDINGHFIHTDETKNAIKVKAKEHQIILGKNILKMFISCDENFEYLYCVPAEN